MHISVTQWCSLQASYWLHYSSNCEPIRKFHYKPQILYKHHIPTKFTSKSLFSSHVNWAFISQCSKPTPLSADMLVLGSSFLIYNIRKMQKVCPVLVHLLPHGTLLLSKHTRTSVSHTKHLLLTAGEIAVTHYVNTSEVTPPFSQA